LKSNPYPQGQGSLPDTDRFASCLAKFHNKPNLLDLQLQLGMKHFFEIISPAFLRRSRMHIAEGIITGSKAVLYTGAGVALVGCGVWRMKKFVSDFPDKRPLLGMGGALIFFISLIPLPAFTGTCSHPCGTPLIGILLGPLIGFALTGVSLLLQAAFFAHGGFGTWGANVVALGFFGCFFGWLAFRAARLVGLPIWAAGFAGGLIGDIMVYAGSGLILATTLAQEPNSQYSLTGYLIAVYSAYLPTQLPIATAEMVVTGLALQHAYRQRPEVMRDLGIIKSNRKAGKISLPLILLFMTFAGLLFFGDTISEAADNGQVAAKSGLRSESTPAEEATSFMGMDEAVNEKLAEAAGRPARDPYINTEAMGDLWNLLLLAAGGVCGFVVGRWWHILWGDRPKG
jgi:cobalt/nickel transport system permease protein